MSFILDFKAAFGENPDNGYIELTEKIHFATNVFLCLTDGIRKISVHHIIFTSLYRHF